MNVHSVKILQDSSASDFLSNAGEMLYRDEPTHSLMLGIVEGVIRAVPKTKPLLLRVVDKGITVMAALQTPPMNLILSFGKEEYLRKLAQYLFEMKINFPGVVGPHEEASFFAEEWAMLTAKKKQLAMGQKIYKIEKVNFPQGIPGELNRATGLENDLVAKWVHAFVTESLPKDEHRSEEYWHEHAGRVVKNGYCYLWKVNGQAVAMASVGRPTKNGISVSGVYTPVELRKKGYASALVAHLSQKMIDEGKKFCVLYTDLANPTSNKIYQDVGYREVSDSMYYLFK